MYMYMLCTQCTAAIGTRVHQLVSKDVQGIAALSYYVYMYMYCQDCLLE